MSSEGALYVGMPIIVCGVPCIIAHITHVTYHGAQTYTAPHKVMFRRATPGQPGDSFYATATSIDPATGEKFYYNAYDMYDKVCSALAGEDDPYAKFFQRAEPDLTTRHHGDDS